MPETIKQIPDQIEPFKSKWQKLDTQWMLTLIGTAVGAGILFLPISAGLGGIWPLILTTLLIGPVIFFAHQGLTRFCLSSSNANSNITNTVTEHFGHTAGNLITLGYFLAIFPILMIYATGITNTINFLLLNQLNIEPPPRALLSILLIGVLVSIMVCNQRVVLKICSILVYPLIAILIGTSIYLIPQWNTAPLKVIPTPLEFIQTLFISIPVLVFSFNHSPAISSFSSVYRKNLGDNADLQASRVLAYSALLLVGFTMLFVCSCVMTLSPAELIKAKAENLTVMSLFAERTNSTAFGWLAQIVAITAITSSFFGHYMGTTEGLKGLIVNHIKRKKPQAKINIKKLNFFTTAFITISIWAVAYLDISIMKMIESIVAPIIATILFIMPMLAIKKVTSMKKYKSITNIFTLLVGIITMLGCIASIFL